jgi:hypothetical protein
MEPTVSAAEPHDGDRLKTWAEPALVKLDAGAAETGFLYGPDGTTHS